MLVDDDEGLSRLVAEVLAGEGYDTVCFSDAAGALEWLKEHKPELIISDIRLPGISGVKFCGLLKADLRFSHIPVLMLSALREERYKVDAFKAGAEDYVVKPFSSRELLARLEALLRRTYHNGGCRRELVSGGLALDLDAGQAAVAGRKLALLPKECALLTLFLKKRGHVLSFSTIREFVWGLESVTVRATIKVTVSRLRRKLGAYGTRIDAVPGAGYRWTDR